MDNTYLKVFFQNELNNTKSFTIKPYILDSSGSFTQVAGGFPSTGLPVIPRGTANFLRRT